MNALNIFRGIALSVGGFFGWYLGGFDGLMIALVVFVCLDYITGVMASAIEKKLSSQIGFKGIFKKVLIFLIVGAMHILDLYMLKQGNTIRDAVVCFYIANEGLSVLENAGRLGLPIPSTIKKVLEQLKARGEGNE